jgi:DNA replication protein DnaC
MTERLKEYSKKLRLGNIEELYEEVEFKDRRQYLTDLFALLVEQRRAKRVERLIKKAGFPAVKTLEGYDFGPITFPRGLEHRALVELEFLKQRENLLMLGAVGTGKTRLAVALGVKACLSGHNVKFYRVADLINDLMQQHLGGSTSRLISQIAGADLLILDEVGYVPFSKRASELLFNVVSRSYERQCIIITSNLEFGRWNEVFGDDRLTAALIDRLVHHSHILAFSGESFRLRQALAKHKGGETRTAEIQA